MIQPNENASSSMGWYYTATVSLGGPFKIQTDQTALRMIQNMNDTTGNITIRRLCLYELEYDVLNWEGIKYEAAKDL